MKPTQGNAIKNIRDKLLFYSIVCISKLFRLLPRRFSIAVMRLVGRILYIVAGRMRRRTIKNLSMVFGKERSAGEIRNMARQVFLHFSSIIVDILGMPKLIDQGLDRIVDAKGLENIDKAMLDGKGVILLAAHLGNWELMGAWAAQNGYPIKVVGRPVMQEQINQFLVNIRNQAGYKNIERGKATREIIRSLREGSAVGILIDQDTKVPGVFVDFFGRPTHTPVGAVQLAMKFGVDIVPVFMYLQKDFTYRLECEPAIDMDYTGNIEEDLFNNTQKCSDAYERIISRFPEQWVWMHKRWKTQPEQFGEEAVGSKKVFG